MEEGKKINKFWLVNSKGGIHSNSLRSADGALLTQKLPPTQIQIQV